MHRRELGDLSQYEIRLIMEEGMKRRAVGVTAATGETFLIWAFEHGEGVVPIKEFFGPYIKNPLDFFLQKVYDYE